jgi:hypothetical protein
MHAFIAIIFGLAALLAAVAHLIDGVIRLCDALKKNVHLLHICHAIEDLAICA